MDDINKCFLDILDDIKNILNSEFYYDKGNLNEIKKSIEIWKNNFKSKNTLKNIDPNVLKQIDLDITDLFDLYIEKEDIKKNYIERLSYDFSKLENYWKEEMLGGK